MALVAGSKIGHYTVNSLIGAGGMGELYRARESQEFNRSGQLLLAPTPSLMCIPAFELSGTCGSWMD